VKPNILNHELKKAVFILKQEGAKKVFLFGSTVAGKAGEKSDYDLGVKGLPPEYFFNTYNKITNELKTPVDLVDFDKEEEFFKMLKDIDEVVEIG